MFETIDHIGLAVTDIAEAVTLYQTQFGVQGWEIIELPERHMRVAITTIGTSMVELIAPTAPEAAFAKYLAEKGPGMHHIAYRVADITAALATLKAQLNQAVRVPPVVPGAARPARPRAGRCRTCPRRAPTPRRPRRGRA
jgi:methylmalonyl-CoA/ethylmalonyl-CoA epimerase